jgi:tetratricopeptide (TPR) repeat protein
LSALSLVDMLEGEERYALQPLTRTFVRDELLADANVTRDTGMRFARHWMGYVEQYGRAGKSNPMFDRLETEWVNLDRAVDLLLGITSEECDVVTNKESANILFELINSLDCFLCFWGRWDDNIRINIRAHEIACQRKDWADAGWQAYRVTSIYYKRNQKEEAEFWAKKCEQAWFQVGDVPSQALTLWIRGLIAEQREEYETAKMNYGDVYNIWRNLGRNKEIAITLRDLGRVERRQEQYETAERHYLSALELLTNIDSTLEQPEIVGELGKIALTRMEWRQAQKWFTLEHKLAKMLDSLELIAQSQYGLACVHEAEKRADLALPLAQEALKIFERLQHRDLAEVREFVKKLEKAVSGK